MKTPKRVVLLNALPLNIFKDESFKLMVARVDPESMKREIESAKKQGIQVLSYIRHPSTVRVVAELLGLELQPSSGLYSYVDGDRIYVVTLKKPVRGQEVEVKIEDLDIFVVEKLPAETQ